MKYQYIVIEGVIGIGKTTLAKRMAEHLNATLILEEFVTNTFLEKFYENPDRYAFPTEVGFLVERYQQLESELTNSLFGEPVVADYVIDKSRIFAKLNLNDTHYHIYNRLYGILSKGLRTPDIMVYLVNSSDKIMGNISKRGRGMENDMKVEYIEGLQSAYRQFIRQDSSYPIVEVDVSNLDLVDGNEAIDQMMKLLSQNWTGGLHKFRLDTYAKKS